MNSSMFAVSITARASSTSCSTKSKIGKSIFEYNTCVSEYLFVENDIIPF